MRISTTMWGGAYNPIIPVFQVGPRQWRGEKWERASGKEIARGYVEFFEPDAFVEAEHGLLEEADLGGLRRERFIGERVFALDEVLRKSDHRVDSDLAVGQNIFDALRTIYETERRFQLRDEHPAFLVRPIRASGLVESMFGAYPPERPSAYISQAYRDVYRPEEVTATPDIWRKVFLRGGITPLRTTRHGIDVQRYWHDDLTILFFDPAQPTDLIDLWNMRGEARPVAPIPLEWVDELAPDIAKLILAEHRPIVGNPHGVMHHATVEVARSISKAVSDRIGKMLGDLIPADRRTEKHVGPLVLKGWRTRIWQHVDDDDPVTPPRRIELDVQDTRVTMELDGDTRLTGHFDSLAPDFAARYGGGHLRWINSVTLSSYAPETIASVFPFNTFDRSWPDLAMGSEEVLIGREGWSFAQEWKDWSTPIYFLSPDAAVTGALKRYGFDASLSENGYIAKQIIEHLGGLFGLHLISDAETLEMLNDMAGGVRKRILPVNDGSAVEEAQEHFGARSRPMWMWENIAKKRKGHLPEFSLDELTTRNVLRLGIETKCPHCTFTNWHSIAEANYDLRCERCLKTYPFPQAKVERRTWSYRVVGPFSVPDYAKGAYGAVLALRALKAIGLHSAPMTYLPGVKMVAGDDVGEADYVAFISRDGSPGTSYPPRLVIGEAKSFGEGDLIKDADISKLKRLATRLPGAIIAISVLRDTFTESEKDRLRKLVTWGRRGNNNRKRNLVLLLTGVELFEGFGTLSHTWKKRGGRYADFSDYHNTRGLREIAESSVAIHLNMQSLHEELRAKWERRAKVRQSRAQRARA